MAAIDTSRPVVALNGGNGTKFFSNLIGTVVAWNDARVTRNALSKLTDRELDDIGLTRGDVQDISTIIR